MPIAEEVLTILCVNRCPDGGDFIPEINSCGWFLDENRYHHTAYAYQKTEARDGAVKNKVFLSMCLILFVSDHFIISPFCSFHILAMVIRKMSAANNTVMKLIFKKSSSDI